MNLKTQLMEDMRNAMRAKDSDRLGVIRYLMAEIKNAQIDGAGDDDSSIQKVVASQVKKTKDAIADFTKAGRDDLITAEEAKIKIMETYLPAQLSDEGLEKIVAQVLAEAGEATNQGQIMGTVMKQVAGQADGGRVAAMVNKLKAAK